MRNNFIVWLLLASMQVSSLFMAVAASGRSYFFLYSEWLRQIQQSHHEKYRIS